MKCHLQYINVLLLYDYHSQHINISVTSYHYYNPFAYINAELQIIAYINFSVTNVSYYAEETCQLHILISTDLFE